VRNYASNCKGCFSIPEDYTLFYYNVKVSCVLLILTIVSPNCRVASQIPTLCEVGRKEERETLDGKVGEEPLPYSIDINMIIKKNY